MIVFGFHKPCCTLYLPQRVQECRLLRLQNDRIATKVDAEVMGRGQYVEYIGRRRNGASVSIT